MLKRNSIWIILLLVVFVMVAGLIIGYRQTSRPKYTQVFSKMSFEDFMELCGPADNTTIFDNKDRGETIYTYEKSETRSASGCYGTFTFDKENKLSSSNKP